MNYTETAVIYSPSLGWVWPTLAGPVRLRCMPVFNVLDPGRLFSWGSSHGSHHTQGGAPSHASTFPAPLRLFCHLALDQVPQLCLPLVVMQKPVFEGKMIVSVQ